MKRYSHKKTRNSFHSKSKSKSTSKLPSSRNSKSSLIFPSSKLSKAKLKLIETIQRNWRIYYRKKIENKIIKIQSIYRGYNIRKIFNDIMILNKKLECFFFIVKMTMFRHGIKYDYLANKRIDYYSDHKKARQFLLLQRRIKYFLFMKKIKILDKMGIFDDIYIKTIEYRIKIKSKISEDKYYAKPIYKYHVPLTEICMIQRNYRMHLKFLKKLPRHNINKLSLNKCPLITKHVKIIKIKEEDIYKNVKMKPINTMKDFYNKIIYKCTPLLLIQRKYKKRFNNLKENYKLKKHSKIKKKVINKHHYIYHAKVINEIEKILILQKNIKYFLYRKHSIVNLIPKIKFPKCQIGKSYGFRELIKKYFYEEFVTRLIFIIRKFFILLYLNELIRNYKYMKISRIKKVSSHKNIEPKSNKIRNQTGLNDTNKAKQLKRKETFNLSPQRLKPVATKPRHSNLLIPSDTNSSKDKGSGKKKVTFKNEKKFIRKETKVLVPKGGNFGNDNESSKFSKSSKNESSSPLLRKSTFGGLRNISFNKK